jgi:hypothetical protein
MRCVRAALRRAKTTLLSAALALQSLHAIDGVAQTRAPAREAWTVTR